MTDPGLTNAGELGIALRATGRSRRRLHINRLAEICMIAAAAIAIAALVILVWSVFSRGVSALNWDFFVKGPATFGQSGGGIAPAIVGTFILVATATVLALPTGVLTAIYVSEFAPRRLGEQVRLWLDVLNGFPSIVIGIFVFALCVKVKMPLIGIGHHQSAIAGGFALSIIMLPLVARATMEVLSLVPSGLREASYALGVSKWRTVLSVVLPTSLGGILTGTTLAVARAAGETAPLLFTCAIAGNLVDWNPTHSMLSMPLLIFEYSESPDSNLNAQAWAAAFVLIAFVLIASLTARLLYDRSRRKLGQAR
jgi:phosphate transport system permease protein